MSLSLDSNESSVVPTETVANDVGILASDSLVMGTSSGFV